VTVSDLVLALPPELVESIARRAADLVEADAAKRVAPPLHDLAAVAARLDVHERTVQRLVQRGELPVIRIGSTVRFDSADVDALIERHRTTRHPSGRSERARSVPRSRVAAAVSVSFADQLRSARHERSTA
jgi:excisionase family DNA binding protein